MSEQILGRVTDLLWDVFVFVLLAFALIVTLLVLRGFARMPFGAGTSAHRQRSSQKELEELPPNARRRAQQAKDKTVRRSWFGFASRKHEEAESYELPE